MKTHLSFSLPLHSPFTSLSLLFFFSLFTFLLLTACSTNNTEAPTPLTQDALLDSIDSMDLALREDLQFDTTKSNKMVAWCLEYAERFPEDSMAPVYLLKTAQIQINSGEFEQGLATLDSIIELYPGFEDVAICQYLKGQAYEQNQQYDKAREAYTLFVTNYPDHYLAPDTRKMLPLVGLSPEEQLEKVLAQKNQKATRKR